jgi:hypothetical protein
VVRIRTVMAALVLGFAATSHAQTNTFVGGTQYVTPGLTGFATTGQDMTGMIVEWQFASVVGIGSATWGSLGGGFHGVTGANGFRVQMGSTGDSFSSNWELQNSSTQRLAWIRFRGAAGRTVFDCGWNGTANPNRCNNIGTGNDDGSAGSADGYSLETVAGGSFAGSVFGEYSNAVSIIPNAPVGDLFEQLTITFGGIMGANQSYFFRADTDSSPSNLPPPTVVLPEPSTYALLASGLAIIIAVRRRRNA